jgi:hypothetical protein
VKIEQLLPDIKLDHCVRCHKDFCPDDPDDKCKIEHGSLEGESQSEGDWDDIMYKYYSYDCGCTVPVKYDHSNYHDVNESWVDGDNMYCHVGEHITEFELPTADELLEMIDYEGVKGNCENDNIHRKLAQYWADSEFIEFNAYMYDDRTAYNGYNKIKKKLKTKKDIEQLLETFAIEWKKAFGWHKCDICNKKQ